MNQPLKRYYPVKIKNSISFFLFLVLSSCGLCASEIPSHVYGKIKDKITGEGLPYVYIIIPGTSIGTTTDTEGNYYLPLHKGKYTLKISYMLYKPEEIPVEIRENEALQMNVDLIPDAEILNAVTVSTSKATNSEEFILTEMKQSSNVVSGISSQQISKSQDNNASEIMKRIPGVTLLDGRFVAIRGLSQRYNNVWINHAAAPGSESDSRAFSFDFIPSSMIENIMIYKNLSPELPADFSGGFIQVTTKDIPVRNHISISYGTGFRSNSTFRKHHAYSYSAMDAVGAGSSSRRLPEAFPGHLDDVGLDEACAQANKMNSQWKIKNRMALPDQNISFALNNVIKLTRMSIGQTVYISYGYSNDRLIQNNNSYGIYNIERNEPSFSKRYTDTQYIAEVKTSVGYNLSFLDRKANKIAFKNLFQNIGKDLTTFREGINYSNNYMEKSREFLYRNKLTYAAQLEGSHRIKKEEYRIVWALGYTFSRNNEPDRRIMESRMDQNEGSTYYGQYKSMDNDIRRYFQTLNEHGLSGSFQYEHLFDFSGFKPSFKTGIYGEYKIRNFKARNFTYQKGIQNNLTPDYYYLPYEEMMKEIFIRPDGFYLKENTGKADSYRSSALTEAAYITLNIPFFGIMLSGGLRTEHQYLTLDSYESDGIKAVNIRKHSLDFFPAANLSYSIKETHVFRVVYGKTVNRPEFREIAPYVYYDFENFSYWEGNPDLKNAQIHNLDFRYEYYPAPHEMISFGAFYKKFINPIENTYYYAGGQLQYSYMNAYSAYNYGIELDIRKSLDFIRLPDFSLVLNASFIKSRVIFPDDNTEPARAMQGQSPYILNTGVYYEHKKFGLSFGILYNILGKRIMAVGQINQNANENIPHTYEMPRHSLDASIQKTFGRYTLRLGAKNLLNQKVIFSQIGTYEMNGKKHSFTQNTKTLRTGIQMNISFSIKMN